MNKSFESKVATVILAFGYAFACFNCSATVYAAMGSAPTQKDQDSRQKKQTVHQMAPSKQLNSQDARSFSSEMAEAISKSNQKLQQTPSSSTIDRDFAELITTHNQGAIDMAELELKYGKDPEMRQMAQRIIDGQKADNKVIKDWAEKHRRPHPHIDAKK